MSLDSWISLVGVAFFLAVLALLVLERWKKRREALLLALVEGESYGLELIQLCREDGTRISHGSVYRLLCGLEADGLVASSAAPHSERHAPHVVMGRRYYRLTNKGREKILKLIQNEVTHA